MRDETRSRDELRAELKELRSKAEALETFRAECRQVEEALRREVAERKRAEAALKASEERYRTVADFTYDWEIWLAEDGAFLYVSPSCERISGYEPERFLADKDFFRDIVFEADRDRWQMHMAGGSSVEGRSIDFRIRDREGRPVWIAQESRRVQGDDGKPLGQRLSLRDISGRKQAEETLLREVAERKRAEAALKASEERYRTIADFTYDWEIWLAEDGAFLYVSPSCERISGHRAERFLADKGFFRSVVFEADQYRWQMHMADESSVEGRSIDFRIRTLDGRLVWIAQESRRVRGEDGKPLGQRLSLREITERKQAEEALRAAREELEKRVEERTRELAVANRSLQQEISKGEKNQQNLRRSREELRRLTMHQQESIERERARIAREIHDELGQNLTALNMGLARLTKLVVPGHVQATEKLASMKKIVEETIRSVQRIARELRPGVLDDLGLAPALESLARDFQDTTGINVELSLGREDLGLDPERSTVLYRICQEALTNVARHANAGRVSIRLGQSHGSAWLEVADDGAGISPAAITDPESFGLAGMRERVRPLRGAVEIGGAPGKGTKVLARLPLQTPREKQP